MVSSAESWLLTGNVAECIFRTHILRYGLVGVLERRRTINENERNHDRELERVIGRDRSSDM